MNQPFIKRQFPICPICLNRLSCGLLATMLFVVFIVGCGSDNVPETINDAAVAANSAAETVGEEIAATTAEAGSEVASAADAKVANAGLSRTDALLAAITIFMLAIFVGFELITKVPPTLHTPLMSGSNAISGITLVGALLMAGNNQSGWAAFFGMLAVAMATVNVVGGFMVTDRMLSMFRGK